MKVVYITKSFAQRAGVERILADKMNYLAEHYNYEVVLITYEQGDHEHAYPLNKSIKVIDINNRFFTLKKHPIYIRFWKMFKMRKSFKKNLSRVLSQINPDLVISNTYSFNLFDIILSLNYRHIIESHICLDDIRNENNYHNKFIAYIAKKWDERMFDFTNKAHTLVTLTNADELEWSKKTNTNVVTIPNVLTYFPKEINLSHDLSKRIICVGRLHNQKGFDLLIKAWHLIAAKYPDWRIDIFGSGDDEYFLRGIISNYKLNDSIKLNKPVNNIFDEYMNSSFFVLSSRSEGLPLVMIESMSCGLPVVAFDCPNGPSELITPNVDGYLVKKENIQELAKAMGKMIDNQKLRTKMGYNARIKSMSYIKDNIMPLWKNLFETILEYQNKKEAL